MSHVIVTGAELELGYDSEVHAGSHPDLPRWWKVIGVKVPRTASCVEWVFRVTIIITILLSFLPCPGGLCG